MVENESKKEFESDVEITRSEEVQTIIDRMPTYWVKWVVLCVSVLMTIIIILGFVIQYPDTVDGEISITAQLAPVRLVANTNARIHLLKPNKSNLQTGDVIAYLENGAEYKHILQLETFLSSAELELLSIETIPDSLKLGEISSTYNTFFTSFLEFKRLTNSGLYRNMRISLQKQIEAEEAVVEYTEKEYSLKKQILQNSYKQLTMDSILRNANGLSEKEYKQQYNQHLNLQDAALNTQSTILQQRAVINKNKLDIQRITLQEKDETQKAWVALITSKNALLNVIHLWKERYIQYATIDGELEYLGFWRENSYVLSGQELFTIIPDKTNVLGEVLIPAHGAGKVEVGQSTNVKLSKFPYDEYGFIRGNVQSVSRLTNKVNTTDGSRDFYKVLINFPHGLVTNFGQKLQFDFESKGVAEIITKRKSLIERLFDNIKSRSVK